MNIFVFEHVVGGGLASQRLPEGLRHEGAAMLAAAVGDFVSAGHCIWTTVDRRAKLSLDQAQVTEIESTQACLEVFDRLAAEAEATLVIAPETGGALFGYVSRLEAAGRRHLGCSSAAIELCGDKLALSGKLFKAGVPTPATDRRGEAFGFPLVVKPRVGAGCEHTFVVRDRLELEALPNGADRIYQPHIAGRSVSASFLVHGQDIQPLLAGEQVLSTSHKISYAGGRVPIDGQSRDRANGLAIKAIRAVPGLRGFVGVDLVLDEEGGADQVIEINPRLTVSYVAIRHLCYPQIAQAMLDPSIQLLFADDRVLAFDPMGVITENPGR